MWQSTRFLVPLVVVAGLSGCWWDDSGTPVTAVDGSGEDAQISGSDATGTDVQVGTDTTSGTDIQVGTDTVAGTCTSNADCAATSYCARGDGVCTGAGVCKVRPQVCPAMYGPICGCDGKTYGNSCEANAGGTDQAAGGACATLQWFTTCGAPVCSGYTPPAGVALCTAQKEGDACGTAGAQCDPKSDCNQLLVCAAKDPKQQTGGCPISRRDKKDGIHYLAPSEIATLRTQLLTTKLATYTYKAAPQTGRHLGFILDDQPGSPAVDERRDMVDLYGYLSMSVAAIQAQQQQIDAQAKRIGELEAMLQHNARKHTRK